MDTVELQAVRRTLPTGNGDLDLCCSARTGLNLAKSYTGALARDTKWERCPTFQKWGAVITVCTSAKLFVQYYMQICVFCHSRLTAVSDAAQRDAGNFYRTMPQ